MKNEYDAYKALSKQSLATSANGTNVKGSFKERINRTAHKAIVNNHARVGYNPYARVLSK